MSCRVLKRDVEKFVLNDLVQQCKQRGIHTIIGERLPTPKNIIVKNHYQNLGFKEDNGLWRLSVSDYIPLNCHITPSNLG